MAGSLLSISRGIGRVCVTAGVDNTEPEINQSRGRLVSLGGGLDDEVVCQAGRLSIFREVVGAEEAIP